MLPALTVSATAGLGTVVCIVVVYWGGTVVVPGALDDIVTVDNAVIVVVYVFTGSVMIVVLVLGWMVVVLVDVKIAGAAEEVRGFLVPLSTGVLATGLMLDARTDDGGAGWVDKG